MADREQSPPYNAAEVPLPTTYVPDEDPTFRTPGHSFEATASVPLKFGSRAVPSPTSANSTATLLEPKPTNPTSPLAQFHMPPPLKKTAIQSLPSVDPCEDGVPRGREEGRVPAEQQKGHRADAPDVRRLQAEPKFARPP